ncbi:aqualysin-1-like [Glandiceps talaboti]
MQHDGCDVKKVYTDDLFTFLDVIITEDVTLDKIRGLCEVGFVQEMYEVRVANDHEYWAQDRINQRNLPLDDDTSLPKCKIPQICGCPPSPPETPNIYIFDTGINYDHDEFGGRAALYYDYYTNDGSDVNGHGTHVAALAGGLTFGLAKTANIWSVKVLDDDGNGSLMSIWEGLASLLNSIPPLPGVINMSLGGEITDSFGALLIDTVQSTYNMPVVVAAGNENANVENHFPASVKSVITVAASNMADNRAYFSNYGSGVDIFAPGVDITSASKLSNDGTVELSGTSMSSPIVAGQAALIKGAFPLATVPQVAKVIYINSSKNVLGSNLNESPNKLLYACEP